MYNSQFENGDGVGSGTGSCRSDGDAAAAAVPETRTTILVAARKPFQTGRDATLSLLHLHCTNSYQCALRHTKFCCFIEYVLIGAIRYC
jgi:hypothetical protein